MKKLIIMMGIPGSGKSTLAKKILKEEQEVNNRIIIVNRDNIRSMCGTYWISEREPLITLFEDYMIAEALDSGYSVIVDATNLNPKTLAKLYQLAEYENIEVIHKVLRISPIKAYIRILFRTLKGGRYISYKVIKGFYNRYKKEIGI